METHLASYAGRSTAPMLFMLREKHSTKSRFKSCELGTMGYHPHLWVSDELSQYMAY